MSASPLTPLDYIAEGYWQDFLAGRPIAGGIAYETELRACMLDESLESLQRIDTLLSQVRRDMIKSGMWDEMTLLVDERYRNFMVFLAFYAGRVLAQQWQSKPHWYGQFELRKRYPELTLITDDFYQHMAVGYDDSGVKERLFFALEPIGLRLFGHIDRQFDAVLQGGQVESGLYQAVSLRLPTTLSNDVHSVPELTAHKVTTSKATTHKATTHQTTESIVPSADSNTHVGTSQLNAPLNKPEEVSIGAEYNQANAVVTDSESRAIQSAMPATVTTELQTSVVPPESESLIKPELTKVTKPTAKPALPVKNTSTSEMFTQLLVELDEIAVPQPTGDVQYQQARKVLDQFEQHIAKQNKPRRQVIFLDNHIAAKNKALLILQAAAEDGNTAAMLRLAMYELLGEGLTADSDNQKKSGVEWVNQAASKNDSRAQRLLSKMYYQGVGVSQDIDSGKYWLEQAADNGHAEAANLVQQWQQAEVLLTTQKQEQHSTKRYQILIGAIIAVALLIIVII
ncbi:tetratricopeptide repeat protein [Psychrobacter sp. APC 3279]|uniref:tetratricopeptide repeat protein n=1 Tax=unclassified Psychrobacter TaxID=196806 RepID=UPI00191992D4|nr:MULTISPECIES: tetratricopeptide repeat protein [unclassified Psychrobacter]MDN3442552.1 tetratricopeptide repeat protein [Psychrobacter sp. APC 3279]